MIFSYPCALFSNCSWLVCSSSVLNVMCIWGCERLSVPSKPVCGMTLQNMVSTKVFVALRFLLRPLCLDKKIANWYLIFVTSKCCPFWFSSGFLFTFFFGGKRSETLIFGCGQSFMLLYCILSLYKQEML